MLSKNHYKGCTKEKSNNNFHFLFNSCFYFISAFRELQPGCETQVSASQLHVCICCCAESQGDGLHSATHTNKHGALVSAAFMNNLHLLHFIQTIKP